MAVPVPSAETALQLYQFVAEVLGSVLLGTGLILIGLYAVLVSAEILADKTRSKAPPHCTSRPVVAENDPEPAVGDLGFGQPAQVL